MNVSVLVLRREPADHEHFVVPSAVPVIGVGISLALLTQIESETYVRAALLVGLGVALWVVNWLIVRREGPPPREGALRRRRPLDRPRRAGLDDVAAELVDRAVAE